MQEEDIVNYVQVAINNNNVIPVQENLRNNEINMNFLKNTINKNVIKFLLSFHAKSNMARKNIPEFLQSIRETQKVLIVTATAEYAFFKRIFLAQILLKKAKKFVTKTRMQKNAHLSTTIQQLLKIPSGIVFEIFM